LEHKLSADVRRKIFLIAFHELIAFYCHTFIFIFQFRLFDFSCELAHATYCTVMTSDAETRPTHKEKDCMCCCNISLIICHFFLTINNSFIL